MNWQSFLKPTEIAEMEEDREAIRALRYNISKIRKRAWQRMLVARSREQAENNLYHEQKKAS